MTGNCTSPAENNTECESVANREEASSYIALIDLLRRHDGKNGRDGRDGRDGLPGREGVRGPPGPQGEQGLQGIQGTHGPPGRQGEQGERGPQGAQGPPGPRSAGVTYIRWGKNSCPNVTGTELVYAGKAGGTAHDHAGGGVEKLCLPLDPDYINASQSTSANFFSTIQGAEYQTLNGPHNNLYNHNVPCAVCYASTRAAMIMIPAKTQCPSSWTREYYGYLMTEREHHDHYRGSFDCVDVNPDVIPNTSANTDGALFQYVTASCNTGIQCPPYVSNKVISCAVCTK